MRGPGDRSAVATLVALVLAASATPALATRATPRGCLAEGRTDLHRVTVRFNGLEPAKDVARFYEKLRTLGALPCRELTLDKQILSEALMAPDRRTTLAPWVAEMEALICRLNPGGCTKGGPTGKSFVVPDVHLSSFFPFWKRIAIDPSEAPEKDLEGVLARHHVSLPEQADNQKDKIDPGVWLDKTRKANLQFTRRLTKSSANQRGEIVKQTQLVVPIREYSATVDLPPRVADMPQKAFGISDFSFDPDVALKPTARSNGTTLEGATSRYREALKQISMPDPLPPAQSDTAAILLADRGIDQDCLFLHPDRAVPPNVLTALGAGIPPCDPAKHGTHVWGIIGGLVPNLMRGVAIVDTDAPAIEPWDFESHTSADGSDFTYFVNDAVGSARVANFSFDFTDDISDAQRTRITGMVEATPSILYVVAADNRPTPYKDGPELTLPTKLNALNNVVVVTALNEAGTGVWEHAARDASEADEVVHIAAPGVGIPSPCGAQSVGVLDGTSQATAFVSGAAALLVRDGLDDSLFIKRRLAYTADVLPDLLPLVAGGRLNVSRALGARQDKICDFTGGDGVTCMPWTPGVSHLGYETPTGFVAGRTVVLRNGSGQKIAEPLTSNVLRIARMPATLAAAASVDRFVVFYLDTGKTRLRRARAMTLEAFSDSSHHGRLSIHLDGADGTKVRLDLDSLGDFVKRGA